MEYIDIINKIKGVVEVKAGITSFYYGSVFELNKKRNWNYPVIVLSPRTTTSINERFMRYSFVLWYVEKLAKDVQDFPEIQSRAIKCLSKITRGIDSELHDGEVASTPISVFTERFNDICAGAMGDLNITAQIDSCD